MIVVYIYKAYSLLPTVNTHVIQRSILLESISPSSKPKKNANGTVMISYISRTGVNKSMQSKAGQGLDARASGRPAPISQHARVGYVLVFIAGIFMTNPAFMYASIACSAVLLLQRRSRKVAWLGILLIVLQVLVVAVFLEIMAHAAGQVG